MNQAVGTVDPTWKSGCGGHSGKPTLSNVGGWLPGQTSRVCPQTQYATFGKSADFRSVSASQIFLCVDENPLSLNDAALAADAAWQTAAGALASSLIFIDYPGIAHNHGCGFSFCDGHAEIHKWVGSQINIYETNPGQHICHASPDGNPDWRDAVWLAKAASIRL